MSMDTPRTPGHYYVCLPDGDPTEWVLHVNQLWYTPEALMHPTPLTQEDKGLTWQDRWPEGTWFTTITGWEAGQGDR